MVASPAIAVSVDAPRRRRLVRIICTTCKEAIKVPAQSLINLGFSTQEAQTLQLYKGRGCERCSNTGYKGRLGLFEVMEVDDDIRDLILSGASAYEIRERTIANEMLTLRQSGLQKIRDGMTTIEEVVRETVAD